MVYGVGGFVPFHRDQFTSQLLALAQHAANREAAMRRRAVNNQNVWAAAQAAEQQGDLRAASRLYQRLALRSGRTEVTLQAQERLSNIQRAAQTKLQALEDRLAQISGRSTDTPGLRRVDVDETEVMKVFDELDALALEYAGVATVDVKIEQRIAKLRKDQQYAAILQEPTAAELWRQGQDHEALQQFCCAVIVYEQAAALAPAPSADRAKARLKELQADQSVVAATKRCRDLQVCHENYRRAELIKTANPTRAREYLTQIIELAPADTPIHKAAREQIAMLR